MDTKDLTGGFPLKPLTGTRTKPAKEFMVCDIESRDWTRFLVLGHYDGHEFKYFKRLVKYIAYLFSLKKNVQVWAHFGGKFDFLFLLQEAFSIPQLKVLNMIPRGSGILCFDLTDGVYTITFMDSSAILPFSLERICESFKVEHKKLKWDHEKTFKVTRKLVHYLKYDCIGLYEAIQKYREWDLIKRAGPKTTMASQALQVLRLFLEKPIHSLNDEVDAFVRKSYFGGRTEVFKPLYQGKEPIRCYDVNSLYPTVMRSNEFPNRPRRFTDVYYPDEIGFYDAVVEVPPMYIPPLGTVQKVGLNDKYVFPTGVFQGRFSTIELEYAKSQGIKVLKTGQGIIFSSSGYLFKNFIDTLYEMRLKAKETGDQVTDTLTKLLMNSTYGRFGLNKDRKNLVVDDGRTGLEKYCEIKTPFGFISLATEDKRLDSSFSNVAVAAWTTSLSRIHMHKIYVRCADSVYYTDTDSLFTTARLPEGSALGVVKFGGLGSR